MTAPRKRTVKKAPARKAVKRSSRPVRSENAALAPGDHLEFSLSMEIKGPAGALWIKGGVTSQVRPEETTDAAVERVTRFVVETVQRKSQDIVARRI